MDTDEFGDITFDDGKVAVVAPASERSLSYFWDLAQTKDLEVLFQGMADHKEWQELFIQVHNVLNVKRVDQVAALGAYAQKDVSKFIDALKMCPKAKVTHQTPANQPPQPEQAKAEPQRITDDGMYKHDDTIYKVQWNLDGTRLYAKRLDIAHDGKARFVYAPGALRVLKPEHKLTLQQASEFGLMYGTCCICGRTLTNELSIHLGIGPVCGDREFGGEFAFMVTAKQAELAGEAPTKILEDPRLKDPEFLSAALKQLSQQQ